MDLIFLKALVLLLVLQNAAVAASSNEPGQCALLQTTQSHTSLETMQPLLVGHHVNQSTLAAMNEEVKKEADNVFMKLQQTWKSSPDAQSLGSTWYNAYRFTAERTLKPFDDGTVFVSTGDISQMWLRDSAMQLHVYIPLAGRAAEHSPVRQVLEAAMARQIRFFLSDPYASAFFETSGPGQNQGPSKRGCPPDANCPGCSCHSCLPACGPWTYQTDFELDSPFFVLLLHHEYWKRTGSIRHLTDEFHEALRVLLDLLQVEQYHQTKSPYNRKRAAGNSFADGIGLIWSQGMPSDDPSHPYNVPQNMMAAVLLQKSAEICLEVFNDSLLADQLLKLSTVVEEAVNRFGIVEGPGGEKIFAYEVDGRGSATLMDDANYPNLLWMPILGFKDTGHHYKATRQFVLSQKDPSFFNKSDSFGHGHAGLGSSHESHGLRRLRGQECRGRCIWHLGLIMRGMTAESSEERVEQLKEILDTTAGTRVMHEGFRADDASVYNRDDFGWANAQFAEWVLDTWLNGPER